LWKLSRVWIWQHEKRTDDYKIILNCVRKLIKKREKAVKKGPHLKSKLARLTLVMYNTMWLA